MAGYRQFSGWDEVMNMFKYQTDGYGLYMSHGELKKVEIEKETDKTVVVDGQRSHKISEWHYFWDTFDEAREFLIQQHKKRIEYFKERLKHHEDCLVKFTEMKEEDLE